MNSGTFDSPRPSVIPRRVPFLAGIESTRDFGTLIGTAVLPFVLVLYLGLKGGGYDSVVRSEVGIAVWWIVLAGCAAGLLPVRPLPRWAKASLFMLFVFGAWTACGVGWSDSAERSVAEVARVSALLGIFALAAVLQTFGSLRLMAGGVAAAIALVGLLALGSRLHPGWFPASETSEFLPGTESRLSWPLNYWNGLATLMAMGIPLLMSLATSARSTIVRSLSAAAVPALALAAFCTLSRGGAFEIGIAMLVLVALSANRLSSSPTWIFAGAGAAILIIAANQREALTDGMTTAPALQQGDEMLVLTVIVCAAVALIVAALNLGFRSGMLPPVQVPRRVTQVACLLALTAATGAFFAVDGPSRVSDGFEEFKSPENVTAADPSRFSSLDGTFRWQLWENAVDANESAPLTGIGPGTFEFWWAENGSETLFVRDAHSLYLETLAELGIVGLVVLLLLLGSLFAGCLATLRRASGSERIIMAGVLAAMSAFIAAAAIDWAWELSVLPVVFLLLAAAGAGGRRRPAGNRPSGPPAVSVRMRLAAVVISAAALVGIVVPLASSQELRASQAAANQADLPLALSKAQDAESIQPFAASPPLQRALVLEESGDLQPAATAAREATDAEPTNWRTWFVLARIQAQQGNADAALESFGQAKALNPRSPILNGA